MEIPVHYYFEALNKYMTFTGRSRRKEWWSYCVIHLIISTALSMTFYVMLENDYISYDKKASGLKSRPGPNNPPNKLYLLVTILPTMAVTVRRLHDTGRSGFAIFILLIPVLGLLFFVIWMSADGDDTVNLYGQNPKESISQSRN